MVLVAALREQGDVDDVVGGQDGCPSLSADVIQRLALFAALDLNLLRVKDAGLNHIARGAAKDKHEAVSI